MTTLESVPETSVLVVYGPSSRTTPEFVQTLTGLTAHWAKKSLAYRVVSYADVDSVVDVRREALKTCRDQGHTHVVFLEPDVSFAPEAFANLLEIAQDKCIVGAACPLPRLRWANVGRELQGLDDQDPKNAERLARGLARSVDYAFVLPKGDTHTIEQGLLTVSVLGFGATIVPRAAADALLRWESETPETSLFGSASGDTETAFGKAAQEAGVRLAIHVGVNVTRFHTFAYPGSVLDVFRDAFQAGDGDKGKRAQT